MSQASRSAEWREVYGYPKEVIVRGYYEPEIPLVCACCGDDKVKLRPDKPLLQRFPYCDPCGNHRSIDSLMIPLTILFFIPVGIWKFFFPNFAPRFSQWWFPIPYVAAGAIVLISRLVWLLRSSRSNCTALKKAVNFKILPPSEVLSRLKEAGDVVRAANWSSEREFLAFKFTNSEVGRKFATKNQNRAWVPYGEMSLPPLPSDFGK